MIDVLFLQKIATKSQTTLKNIAREYIQHLVLSNLYKLKRSEDLFFKGGTALRFAFRSPRYSEDLDFTISCGSAVFENLLENVLLEVEKANVGIDLQESKSTSGGHLAIVEIKAFGLITLIKMEGSQRKKELKGERVTITSDLFPSYSIQILERKLIVGEKVEAFLTRLKVRDFFDLYYLLRANLEHDVILSKREQIVKVINSSKADLSQLKVFLPRNFSPLLKDLKNNLLRELR